MAQRHGPGTRRERRCKRTCTLARSANTAYFGKAAGKGRSNRDNQLSRGAICCARRGVGAALVLVLLSCACAMESHASLLSLSAAPTNVSVMGPLLYSAVTKLVAQPRPGRTVMGFGRSQVVEQGLVAVAEYGGASMFAMSDPGSPAGNWQFVFDLGLHEPDSTGVNTRARIAMHHGWVVSGYKDVSYLFAPVANATASIHNAAWRQIASFPIGDEVSICAPGENAPLPDGAWGPGPLHDGIGPPTLQASVVVLASDSTNEVARVFAPAIASQPRGNWTTVTTLSQAMVPESVVSGWGAAVALHVNTSGVAVAFIGSPNDNTLDTSMGAVYQFVAANASDANSWVFVATFSGSTVENRMFFGSALALSSCGTLLAAGGPGQFFGVVGVFEPASSGDWGAPVEWVERVSLRHGNTGTSFGRAIGISSTSQCVTVVAGAQNDDTVETNGGAVFAFASSSRDLADTSTAWRATKIVDPDATSSFQLGMSVSISGTTVMAGAASRVEVFVLSLGLDAVATNIQPTSGSHSFGSVTAIDPDSGCPSNPVTACARVVVGAPDVGRAYIMSGDPRDPSHWAAAVELVAKDSTSASSDKFGRDVAISQGVVLVGGGFRSGVCSQGCGYVFVCSDTGGGALSCPRVAVLAPTFDVPSAGPNAEAVALSWPARLAALSCDDKVCLYHATDASGSAWTEAAVLRPPHLEPPGYYYSFGTSLALGFTPGDDGSPPTPVVATNGRPVVNGATGWVHVYTPVTPGNLTSWHLTQMLGATATSSTSDFAKIVSAAPDASLLGGTGASGEAIRLFRRTPSAVKWDFEAALLPLSSVQSATSKYASASKFGSSLSIGSGGLTVAVGASGDASSGSGNGAAYVFKATSNRTASVAYTWNRVVRMTPRSFLNAGLGASASGHSVAVGAGFVVAGGSKRGLAYVLPLVSFAGDIRDMPLPLALRAAGCIGDDQLLTKDVCPPLLLGAGRRTSYAQPTPEQLFDVGYQHLKLLSQRPLGLVGHVPQGQCWTRPPVRFQVQSFNLRDVPWYASQLRFQPAAAQATSWVDGGLLQIMPSDPSVSVALRRCYLEGGVGRRGGAVFVANAGLELTDTTFSGGAAMQGGAVAVAQDATLAMTGCMISGAVASQHGGAVSATLATVMIGSSLFGNNTAGARGGGVYAGFGSDVGVTDTTFAYCTAAQGGAVGTEASTVSLNSVAMLWNFASSTGGGLYVDTTSTMTGRSINVTRNTAASGGGVSVTGGVCTLRDSTFDGNTATQHGGGGVWCQSSGQLSLTGATIENNAAQLRGGGLGADHCVTNLTRCTVSANTVVTVANEGVDEGGGGVFASAALDADDTAVAFVLGSATVLRANSALRGAGSLFNTVALGGEVCGKTALTCSGLPNAAFDVSRTAIVEDVTLWLSFPPLLPTGFSGPLRSMAAQAVAFPYNVSAESGMTLPSVRLSLLDVYGHPALPLEGTQAFASIHNTSSAIAVGSASLLGVLVATFNGMFADFASLGLLAVPGSTVWLSLSTNQPDVAAALLAVQVAECPPGTQLGLRNVSCTACSVGWHSPGGAAPGLCQPCPAGYYAVDAGRGGCVPCGSTSVYCPAGSGAPVPVSPGYYSTPTDSPAALRTGQQICEAGRYCSAGTGTAVDCGSAAVWCGIGATSPTLVTMGYYSEPEGGDPARRTSEQQCEPGFYCSGGVRRPCGAGRFGDVPGLSTISCAGPCSAGHYCAAGATSSVASVCPAGWYCLEGSASPTGVCEPGHFCPVGSTMPRAKPCGSVQQFCPAGATNPLVVGVGNMSVGVTPETRRAQVPCPLGFYCTGGVSTPCPAGRFGAEPGLSSSDCSGACRAGWFCLAQSTTATAVPCGSNSVYCPAAADTPLTVPAGMQSVGGDAATRNGTLPCPAGTFAEAGWGVCSPCGPGEIAGAGSDKCKVCPDNTYAAEGHAECLPCVSKGATCQEGILTPMSGFWSPALVLSGTGQPSINLSAVAEGVVFYECPPGACVLDERSRITCAPHRTGPLCALCQGDYVLAGDQCESCGSTGANVVLLVLCTSVLLVGVVFVIRKATAHLGTRTSSKGSATKNENLVLALFKIITNYLQVVSQLGGFEVPWGSMVSTLFSLSSSSSSAPVSASFLQCTLRLSPYSRFLVVAAAPVVATTVWLEAYGIPGCEEVDGVSYLKADYNINCASPKRRAFAVAASVTLAVFSLGLPAMSACILWRAQRGASSPSGEGVESLAFLTNGFKPQYRYWECIQMLRKFLIVAVAVLWSGAIDGLQLALGLGCVLVFLGLQATANPFANKTQDSLELAAHVATAFSLYGGWVLTMELSDTMSQAVQWAIISVTSAFLLVWLTLVVKESNRVLKRIRKKAGKRFSRRSSHNRQPVHRASVSDWLSNPMNEGGEDVPRETRRPAALVQLQRFTAQNAGSSKRAAADGVAPVLKAGSRPAGATDR